MAAGRRRQLSEVWPGIVATLALGSPAASVWPLSRRFSNAYVTYYAGLASAMIGAGVSVFHRLDFIYGGELNAAIGRERDAKKGETIKGSGWISATQEGAAHRRRRRSAS